MNRPKGFEEWTWALFGIFMILMLVFTLVVLVIGLIGCQAVEPPPCNRYRIYQRELECNQMQLEYAEAQRVWVQARVNYVKCRNEVK